MAPTEAPDPLAPSHRCWRGGRPDSSRSHQRAARIAVWKERRCWCSHSACCRSENLLTWSQPGSLQVRSWRRVPTPDATVAPRDVIRYINNAFEAVGGGRWARKECPSWRGCLLKLQKRSAANSSNAPPILDTRNECAVKGSGRATKRNAFGNLPFCQKEDLADAEMLLKRPRICNSITSSHYSIRMS